VDEHRGNRRGRLRRGRGLAAGARLGLFAGYRCCLHLDARLSFLLALHRRQGARARRLQPHARRAAWRRTRLRADEPLGRLRPSLRRDRRSRPPDRPRPRGAVRLSPRDDLDPRGCRPRRRRPGLRDPRGEPAPRRPVLGQAGSRLPGPGGRLRGNPGHPPHHGDPHRRPRARRRQRARREPVGGLYRRHDDPDRNGHGRDHARRSRPRGARGHGGRRRPPRPRPGGRALGLRPSAAGAGLHAGSPSAGAAGDCLRALRVDPAGLASSGAARLPVDLREAGHRRPARHRHSRGAPGPAAPGPHAIRRSSRSASSPSPAGPSPASTR
jgi:hypothetical protein